MKIYYKSTTGVFDAVGIVDDGSDWIVCKGSRINPSSSTLCKNVVALRMQEGLVVDNILQKDIHFRSASAAAQFVSGYSSNGMRSWRTDKGEYVSKYIIGQTKKPRKRD